MATVGSFFSSISQTRQEFRALARIFCLLHVLHKNQRKPEKMCLGETPPVGSSRTLDPCRHLKATHRLDGRPCQHATPANPRDPDSPKLRMVMEPKYLAFRRQL